MPKIRFDRFTKELLSLYSPRLRSKQTHAKMRQVLAEVGRLPSVKTTADLTPAAVASFVERVPGRNPNTVNGYLAYLRKACNYAVARGYLQASPFDAHDFRLRPRKPIDRHLGLVTVRNLLDHLAGGVGTWEGHRLYALIATFAYTGLRRDEGLRLHRADIKLAEGVLWVVNRTGLKTEAAEAPIPLADELVQILGNWLPLSGSVWAFPNKSRSGPWTGGPPGKRPLDEAKAAAEAAGIPGLTFQGLRQTWATMAESRWMLGELTVQRVLRHTTVKTQKRYRKADLDNLREAVRTINFEVAHVAAG